jgi:hypothetical protein
VRRFIRSIFCSRTADGGLDRYYTSMVGVCGSSKVQQCGQDLAQEIGVTIEDLRAAFAKVSTKKPFDSPP